MPLSPEYLIALNLLAWQHICQCSQNQRNPTTTAGITHMNYNDLKKQYAEAFLADFSDEIVAFSIVAFSALHLPPLYKSTGIITLRG